MNEINVLVITVYNSIVHSHLDYCCEVCDTLEKGFSGELQMFQSRAGIILDVNIELVLTQSWGC